ncbi:hypothetical protein BPAE_0098g00140 [Botrytis paeoniae]|uniref:Uncharacterized protein n=1 Tax=Botrytis paeoniae TaxID=278948 RepID=A0A4Z1FJJ0_9HELO|nr:hypothetical protein BPAE_0098g00140 [Botrytis paeoniae]
MSRLLDTTRNFSLYSVPAAWLLAHIPHIDYPQSLEADQSIEKAKKNRLRRAHAAASNGYENIGFFASAVVAGNVAGLSHSTLNTLTGAYLISRAVYNFIYINNETQGAAAARSLVWLFGIGQIFTLFIKSGNLLTNKAANLL